MKRKGKNGLPVTMNKPRSPLAVTFDEDPADRYFLNVTVKRHKTGITTETHYILRADMGQWLRMYEREGFRSVK